MDLSTVRLTRLRLTTARLAAVALLAALAVPAEAQTFKYQTHTSPDGKFTYQTVTGDPLKARIYKLKNGLTVYLTVNKNEPRVQTAIAVRAGSKNDPADATGLAHYLEHMLFKGTDRYGSLDYSKERVELDRIEQLFEEYRKTTDESKRKELYHRIDSISGVAANYAIPNEYDKMVGALGAKGTNAYTSNEQTVYVNDIPSNQLQKWIKLESERFRKPVLRLFHTELEAVYEEKNRTLDNDGRQANEAMLAELFKNHQYGTQSTIGTVEHLKNPSVRKIREYYDTYYVPNNMAICLSGDFDPDQVIGMIDGAWAGFPSKPVPQFSFKPEAPITSPIVREVVGPDAENVTVAFRFPGVGTRDGNLIQMIDMILANSAAGLIDLNLNQQQKVLGASSGIWSLTDYSIHILSGRPTSGQSLEQVVDLLLGQLELVKQGRFDDKLLKAVINDLTIQEIRSYESNSGRVNAFVDAFTSLRDWDKYTAHLNELSKITKQDLVAFAKKNYAKNYVVVYKRSGAKRDVAKVTKPEITPVKMNRDAQSPFLSEVTGMPTGKIQPRFVDYKTDIKETTLSSGIPVFYLRNDENELFQVYYVLDMGKRHDKALAFAVGYLKFLGTDKYSAEDLAKKFYELGSSFNVSADEEQVYVSLTGLSKNFKESVELFEHLLNNAKPDDAALASLIERTLKSRKDEQKNKSAIMSALRSYGTYGSYNPVLNKLSESELRNLPAGKLTQKLKEIGTFEHRVLYYGPMQEKEVVSILNTLHKVPAKRMSLPVTNRYQFREQKENEVLFVDYDMAQAEVVLLSRAGQYDTKVQPKISLYSEYFGGGMSSIVFQTIRESKALAYAVFSTISNPYRADEPNYIYSYVGTQADKLPETMDGMFELLNDMPRVENSFSNAKQSLLNRIETERITRASVLFNYERAKRLGWSHDLRKDVYEAAQSMSLDDVQAFQREYVKGRPATILVVGSKDKIDMKALAKYGKITELSLHDVFGE